MSSATPVGRLDSPVSAESLLNKYNLPEGTNSDAIARVMARLGDLPVSSPSTQKSPPGWLGTEPRRGVLSSGTEVDASARRNQMRFTNGGEPVTRVSWSPASPGGSTKGNGNARRSGGQHDQSPNGTPAGDPLALIQDLYGDDVDVNLRDSARRALSEAGYGSPTAAGGAATSSRTTPSHNPSSAVSRLAKSIRNVSTAQNSSRPKSSVPHKKPTPLTPKETLGKLGELRFEARTATQKARRAERELQKKDQELEELKAKCASLARERSALSVRLSSNNQVSGSQSTKTNPFGGGTSYGSYAFAPPSTNANGQVVRSSAPGNLDVFESKSPFSKTPRKPSGESLSMSSRWNQWEMEARRGDKRLALLMRGYKKIEGEVEAFREASLVARESAAFSEDELEATRSALEELRGNFEAAKELLNEGLEHRDALEQKLRAEKGRNKDMAPELKELKENNKTLESELSETREKTKELLRRSVKRDHKIDALTKKLSAESESLKESEAAREKSEEELTKAMEQCRVLRRRVASLETGAKERQSVENENKFNELVEENQKLSAELDIKEEECNMLAAMVSRASAGGFSKRTGTENSGENTVGQQSLSPLKAAL